MATLTLAFEKEINVSLQIGDYVFYTNSVTTDKNIDHAGGWPTMVVIDREMVLLNGINGWNETTVRAWVESLL